jgi:Uma2 family endonuclease
MIETETLIKPPRTGLEAFEFLPEGTLCQLINDAIIMSPAPNLSHAEVQNEIFTLLYTHVKKHAFGKVFCAPLDVYLNTSNVYQPDIIFISTARLDIAKQRGVFGAPDLVIEILSSNKKSDLVTKKKVYEQSGVLEYWVVDPVTKWCEGFELSGGQYQSMGEAVGTIEMKLLPLTINF